MLVFNFHHVEEVPLHVDRKVITITPKGLQRFIQTLRVLGMQIVSLRDVLENPAYLEPGSRKVVITFDDGLENNYLQALPVLEAEKCPATIFILPGRFSGTNEWDQGHLPEAERDQLMSLEQLQAMGRSPYITYGSHGMMHRNMAELSEADLTYEIEESYDILQRLFPNTFLPVLAYPWGAYAERTLRVMDKSRYQFAFTTEKGQWTHTSSRFEVARYSAYFRDGNPLMLMLKLQRNQLLFGAGKP